MGVGQGSTRVGGRRYGRSCHGLWSVRAVARGKPHRHAVVRGVGEGARETEDRPAGAESWPRRWGRGEHHLLMSSASGRRRTVTTSSWSRPRGGTRRLWCCLERDAVPCTRGAGRRHELSETPHEWRWPGWWGRIPAAHHARPHVAARTMVDRPARIQRSGSAEIRIGVMRPGGLGSRSPPRSCQGPRAARTSHPARVGGPARFRVRETLLLLDGSEVRFGLRAQDTPPLRPACARSPQTGRSRFSAHRG